MAVGDAGAAAYDVALKQRQAMMGASGPGALIKNWKVFRIALFACLGGLLYGYNQGMFSSVLTMPAFQKHMGIWTSDQTKKGWLTAILELGAWLGTLLSGFVAEVLSRKYGILLATAVFIIGVVIQATGQYSHHQGILAGRFITGIGVGALSCIVPIYNSECAPPEVRGSLVALQQFAITFGIMVSFWIGYGTNFIGGTSAATQSDAAWLVPICLQLAPAALLFVGMVFMPFSPRWLVHHGREAEGRKVLLSLRGVQVGQTQAEADHVIELELLEIKAQSLFEKRTVIEQFPELFSKPNATVTPATGGEGDSDVPVFSAMTVFRLQFTSWASLFRTMPLFRRVIVACMVMTFQQWSGVNAILYYAPSIFQQLGMSSNTTSLLATGVVGIVMFIATLPAVLYIDKLGRKPVLIVGALGMAFCHFVIAIILAKNDGRWETQQAAGWAAVAFVWVYVFQFGYSWGPCAWIVISEIWPLSSRAVGTSLGSSANWMNNFIIGQVTPDMLENIHYGTYILFGLLTFIGALFVYFVVPETKRLSLEEMDVVFGSEGTAQADFERMAEINQQIGLTEMLRRGDGQGATGEDEEYDVDAKKNALTVEQKEGGEEGGEKKEGSEPVQEVETTGAVDKP